MCCFLFVALSIEPTGLILATHGLAVYHSFCNNVYLFVALLISRIFYSVFLTQVRANCSSAVIIIGSTKYSIVRVAIFKFRAKKKLV